MNYLRLFLPDYPVKPCQMQQGFMYCRALNAPDPGSRYDYHVQTTTEPVTGQSERLSDKSRGSVSFNTVADSFAY